MKKIFLVLIFIFFNTSISLSTVVDQLERLSDLQKQGQISQEQFEKAKSILLNMEKNKEKKINEAKKKEKKINEAKTQKNDKKNIIIRPFTKQAKGTEEFEKMELIVGDYRVYTHRPGGMKIRRISDNKQLAVYGDKMNLKFYNDSKELFEVINENENRMVLKINNIPILLTDRRFVAKHQAYFFQVLALGTEPFHYYIKLPNRAPIGLNYKKFEKKIAKAVEEAKVLLASTHNVTIEQINLLMKKRAAKATAELEKLIGEKKEEVVQAAINESVDQFLSEQLEAAIGAALANEFVSAIESQTGAAIDQAIEDELAAAIDEAVAAAIEEGISQAAIEAGIAAYLSALAAGMSEADAYAAGEEACGC
tara:strand:- start:624 stop:1721 length:1098 start_codon:yes stop_codon:yes gene_type:complete